MSPLQTPYIPNLIMDKNHERGNHCFDSYFWVQRQENKDQACGAFFFR